MENCERHVIKTILFAVMLVVMLGLAVGAGAACNHGNCNTVLVQSATCCEPGWYDLMCSDCGATVQEKYNEMPATGRHDDTQVKVKSPLCETDGEARFYCNVSGKLVKTEKIDKLGHNMESIGVDAPDCTKPGMIHLQCARCRKTSEVITEQAAGHQFDAGYGTAATCTEDGKNVLCCGICGYEDVEIKPATGHQMKSAALVPSDCEREGLETLECTNPGCDYSEDKIVPKKDHELKTVSVTEPSCEAGGKVTWACAYCGFETYTLGEKALGHDMTGGAEDVPATCEKDGYYRVYCDRCDYFEEEIYPATGHFTAATHVPATCEKEGYYKEACGDCGAVVVETIPKKDHDLKTIGALPAECESGERITWKCQNCDFVTYTVGKPALGHDMTGGAVEVPATCEKDGYYRVYCDRCDYFEEEIYPATGHFTAATHVPATCEKEGYNKEACGDCGAVVVETIPKKDHDLKTIGALPAECESGERITWKCQNCDFVTYTVGKPALGHDMTGGAVEVPATCEKDGYYRVYCDRCDYFEEEIYPATGHFTAATHVPATCEKEGYNKEACGNCDMEIIRTIPKKDHDLKTIGALPAECESGEKITWKCRNCDFVTYTVGKPALGHDMTGGAVEVPATCEKDGYYRVYCDRCDYFDEEIYPAKKHHFRSTGEVVQPTCEEAGYAMIACTDCDYSFRAVLPALKHEMGPAEYVCSTCVKQGYYYEECLRCDYVNHIIYTLVPHQWIYSLTSSSEDRFFYQYRDCAVCGAHNVTRLPR